MIFHNKLYTILILFAFTLLINLPFGRARAKAKKYSFRWFLYIHLPIPLIFLARTVSHIGMKYIPLFVLAAVIGQIAGGKIEI
jgi:hypothetical protein